MWGILIEFGKFVLNDKAARYVLAIGAGLALLWYAHYVVYNKGYDAGELHQQSLYSEQQKKIDDEYKVKLAKANKERDNLNQEINELKSNYAQLLLKRQQPAKQTQEAVREYEKTITPDNDSIGAEWMQIYSQSIPQ